MSEEGFCGYHRIGRVYHRLAQDYHRLFRVYYRSEHVYHRSDGLYHRLTIICHYKSRTAKFITDIQHVTTDSDEFIIVGLQVTFEKEKQCAR